MMPLTSFSHSEGFSANPQLLASPFFQTLHSSILTIKVTTIRLTCKGCSRDRQQSYQQFLIMYSLHLAQKKQKQHSSKDMQERKERHWLKKYNSQIKPKLLQRYDARVNAFIRQIEGAPQDPNKVLKHYQSTNFRPFKLTGPPNTKLNNQMESTSPCLTDMSSGIRRSSKYVPFSCYQFRERQKDKQIKPKLELKVVKYRKWQKERIGVKDEGKQEGQLNRLSARQFFRRVPDDNRSEIPSLYEDNQSLRFSVNENIEGEAREYEKKQELIEKKHHFKRLANLQQVVGDARAKRAIHELLVKGGFTRPKIKMERQEDEVDLLKLEVEKQTPL